MKGKELTVEQVISLPHGTRIVIEHGEAKRWDNDNALVNQERKMIGNDQNRGIQMCMWHFEDLKEKAKKYDMYFYEWFDESQKENQTTVKEGYEFKVGDIVTGLKEDQWLKYYNCEITAIHYNGKVDLKVIEEDRIYKSIWELDELKLIKSKEITEITEPNNAFTKSMLKTGHLVQTRNGRWWFVFRDLSNECFTDGLVYINSKVSTREFERLDRYTDELKHHSNFCDDYDIIKVGVSSYSTSFFAKKDVDLLTGFEIIWQRKETNNTCEKNGIFRHTIDGNTYSFEFKNNKISTIDGQYKGVAKCHHEDQFNKDRGCRLALARAKEKEAKANLNKLHKEIEQLTK